MVDTARFQLGPKSVQVVGGIVTEIGRTRPTHALQVATYLPLDIESVARILDSLEAEEVLGSSDDTRGFKRIKLRNPEEYAQWAKLAHTGEHLEDPALKRNLVALRSDSDWCRKVRDQHRLLRAASILGTDTTLDALATEAEVPPSRVRSVLGDLEAEGYVQTHADDDTVHVYLPDVGYPAERYRRNEALLTEVESKPAHLPPNWWVYVAVATVLLVLFIISRLVAP
jgi:DNA-binding MarR family transcriptional regulator